MYITCTVCRKEITTGMTNFSNPGKVEMCGDSKAVLSYILSNRHTRLSGKTCSGVSVHLVVIIVTIIILNNKGHSSCAKYCVLSQSRF